MKPDDFADQTIKAKRKNEELLPNGAPAVFDVIRDDHQVGDDGRLVVDSSATREKERAESIAPSASSKSNAVLTRH
jgi:hypothetical protein